MNERRRAYFRAHRSASVRRAFVRHQEAMLQALRRKAGCTVIPAGARITATIPIPDDGPAVVAGDAVWVVDRENGAANPDGTPKGSIVRIDTTTDTVTDRIGGVAGGSADEGFGAVWVAAFNFNAVYRIDTATHRVTRLASGPSSDEGPNDVAVTATGVLVANHHSGTVAMLDPATGSVVRSLPIVAPGPGGPQNLLVDGNDLWLSVARDNTVLRIEPTTGSIVQRASVPGGTCGELAADVNQIWIAGGECGFERLSAIQRQTGQVTDIDLRGIPADVASAFESIWVTTLSPPRLLRLDPTTRTVTGSLGLPSSPWAIAAGTDALWIRVNGSLLRVVPQT
jgi:DNA-binding beta-propeller fold protein YncE